VFSNVKNFNLEKLLKVKKFNDFHEEFTAKIHEGTEDIEDYYRQKSSKYVLHNVGIPLIMLNTKDDPIVSKDLIEYQAIKNENLILMVMERGLF
jgi:uncharacterized protein